MPNPHIDKTITQTIDHYLKCLDGETEPNNIYHLIMGDVESCLIRHVLSLTNHNQSKTAAWLGITRNTLKKKMLEHHLTDTTNNPTITS